MNATMILATLTLFAQAAAADENPVLQPASANIVEVAVYPDRARVTRKATVTLPPGSSTVVFKDLTAGLDEASLRARVLKSRNAKVTGLAADWQGSIEAPRAEEAKLEASIEKLQHDLQSERDGLDGLALRRRLLENYRNEGRKAVAQQAAGSRVSSTDWRRALEYLTSEGEKISESERKAQKRIKDLTEELNARQADLNNLRAPASRKRRRVEVAVNASSGGRAEIALDYVVYDAWWVPAYDVREANDKLELTYYGTITQGTGEDWEKVALTLSTARPSESAQVPTLNPTLLSGTKREKRPVTIVSYGKEREKLDKDQINLATKESTGGRAEVDDHGTAVTFVVQGAESIPADRRPHKVQVASSKLDAKLTYETIPKIAPYVYLKATTTNASTFPILQGNVDVFRSSGYIGTGRLDYVATGEEFAVSLGVDEDLKVRRIIDQKLDRKPKFLGTKRRITHGFEIEVSNYKSGNRTITIVENIPISQRKEVEVELGEKTTKPDEKDDQGFVRWKVELEPEETKKVLFSYTVEYPKDFQISGL